MFDDIDPFTCAPGELLARAVALEPGYPAMSILGMVDAAALDPEDALTYVDLHQRQSAWWAAKQVDALVAVASPERSIDEYAILVTDSQEERTIRIEDAVREEVAAAVRWSPARAQRRIDSARLLAGPLAATRAAARRAVMIIDAEGEQRRRQAAKCTRGIHVWDELDGISTLVARMTTESAHAVMTVIDESAHDKRSFSECGSSIGERRVEALARLVLGPGLDEGESGERPTPPLEARLDIVIDLPTLMGLANGGDGTAEIRGRGPIAAEGLRKLLADDSVAVTMRRLVADPLTGHLLDLGLHTYAVSDRLREYLVARDATCRFPGCRRRATRCQIDHADSWDDGGATSIDNLGPLCVRHHQLKTHGGWRITASGADGSCAWLSPMKRRYARDAEPIGPPPEPRPVMDVLPDPPPF
jgi:hypothetical protein